MVGNGQFIHCYEYCPDVTLQLQKTKFTILFFVLPVEGADVVLGISWLGALGTITADFSVPQISFVKDGNHCTLRGEPRTQQVSSSSLSTMLKHDFIASIHTLTMEPTPPIQNPSDTIVDPNITAILDLFQPVFEIPYTLPPTRHHDHHIPLLNNNQPVNVKPYRYPHFQKQIMTQFITEMLQDDISFLGHQILGQGVSPKAEKIAAIQQWPQPTSFTTIRAFLGLTGYYRQFVQHYAQIAAPLTNILKMKEFKWTEDADAAFKKLKKHMQQLITLALPNFTNTFDVTTDASGMAIGAVLSQENKPIAFFSKTLCPTKQGQSTYTKEFYAITEAIKKWRQYLLGRRFRIYTDHHSLKHILTQMIQTPKQQKWVTKLIGYDFEVLYKPGRENTVADALSKVDIPSMFAILYLTATWLEDIQTYYSTDPQGK
ncbi:ty3-gypsy retrotransposon protein [Tanacetum coccineum]|uniref:Ty3-gypsy retrotransposon protein n=1 Tax=Tanacetum coccineum TaxID=301880 RepID=A0ABQ5IBF4_9ASTR